MILLASAKTMKETELRTTSAPVFDEQSRAIRTLIAKMDEDAMAKYFKIKGKTLDTTMSYFKQPQYGCAIDSLSGQVMKQIASRKDQYIKDNVFILDAMYGIINGYDAIELFRLDFTLKSVLNISYYSYWKDIVNEYIIKLNPSQLLILSSDEYTKLLDFQKLNCEIYQIDFDESVKSTVKKKQIRGMICNYAIENEISDYSQLDNSIIDDIKLSLSEHLITVSVIDV